MAFLERLQQRGVMVSMSFKEEQGDVDPYHSTK
jgi:hypothetical protein